MASMDVTVTNQIKLRFNWSQASQNISNNNSVVSWSLQLISTTGTISSSANKSWSVTVNGSKYSGTNTIGISTNTTKTLASGSTTIAHNSDGTKTFSFSFSQQFDINYSGVGHIGTKSGSGSGTLTTIPRTSSVSATSANIGSPITITINRASSSFTHTLTYSFCNLTGTIATKTGSTSVSWTLPTSFYAQIPNAKSSWGRITCQTYNGNTLIGSSECRFDVYVNESSNKPTISATVVDSNATTKTLTGDENKLIKYYSTAKFTVTGSPKNSATIKTLNATYTGNTISKTGVSTWTDQYSGCVSGSYSFAAIDSRGFSVSQTVSKTLINYIKLTCVLDTSLNVNGTLTLKMNGNYFNGSFGAKNNSLRVGYRYKTSGGSYSNWAYVTPTISGNTYTATATVNNLNYQQSYVVQAWAGDQIYEAGLGGDVYSAEKQVSSKPIFDWGKNDFHFHVPVVVDGSLQVGAGKYLYGTGKDASKITMGYINQTNNAVELGTSNIHTTIKSGDNPTWYTATDQKSYNIWTDKGCTSSADNICRTWRHPNGMQVSVVKVYGTWTVNTAWGSVYSSPWISGQSFNVAFSEAPRVTINAYNDNGSSIMVCQCSAPTTTATGASYLWKPTSQTGVKTWIEYIAIGRWK